MDNDSTNRPPPIRPTPVPAAQGQRPRRGVPGCVVALIGVAAMCLLGAVLFACLLVVGLASGGALGGPSAIHTYFEEPVQPSESGKKIAVIRVEGLIVGGDGRSAFGQMVTAGGIKTQFDKAAADDDVTAVILDVNSPGGEVVACDEIYRRIRNFRQQTKKPVVTCMHSFAASGGYYIAAPTDHIVANRMTLTGSIGVILAGYNYSELLTQKLGITPQVYKHGEMKDMGSGARPANAKEQELLQGIVDHHYEEFTKIVAEGRGLELEAFRTGAAGDSRVLTGQQALDLQLVDELGYFDDAVAAARRLVQDPKAGVVRYRPRLGPLDILTGAQAKAQPDLGTVLPIRGLQIKKGHPYFLCPGTF